MSSPVPALIVSDLPGLANVTDSPSVLLSIVRFEPPASVSPITSLPPPSVNTKSLIVLPVNVIAGSNLPSEKSIVRLWSPTCGVSIRMTPVTALKSNESTCESWLTRNLLWATSDWSVNVSDGPLVPSVTTRSVTPMSATSAADEVSNTRDSRISITAHVCGESGRWRRLFLERARRV